MIKGLFKLDADRQVVAGLLNSREFQFYVEKLRKAHASALRDVYACSPQDLPDRRAYARCLNELIEETTGKPGAQP